MAQDHGGKYFIKTLSLRKCKLGYYEFEGEDKEPEEEEESIRTKRLRLKYKPKDFKEALLLQRLEEGDEALIQKITDAELSRQGIVRSEGETFVAQPQGVDLFENLFIETDTGSRTQRNNSGCSKKWFQRFKRDPGGIHLVIGKQRGGKTALCFFLAQATGRGADICDYRSL